MRAVMTGSVENQWLCAQSMSAPGSEMAATEMAGFGASKSLVVTRFDRRWQGIAARAEMKARFKAREGTWIARLPQEDFCQALGFSPDRKYQSEGGPSMQDCLRVHEFSPQIVEPPPTALTERAAAVRLARSRLGHLACWPRL